MSWTPEENGLKELIACLRNSSTGETKVQKQIQDRLDSFNTIPDYNNYLTWILTKSRNEDATVRSMAGLILKNNIRLRLHQIPPPVIEYVKSNIFDALGDEIAMIRSTVSTVIDQLLVDLGPQQWPEAIMKLVSLMDSTDKFTQEGAFATIDKLCQDIPKLLETLVLPGGQPLPFMITKFLQYLEGPDPKIRYHSLSCIHQFISAEDNALTPHLETFLSKLFARASDPSPDMKKLVCQVFVQLLASRPVTLANNLAGVVEFMLYSTQNKDDEEVALEACEFWLTFAEDPELAEHLRPYLPRVIPVLLNCMIYSEADLAILDNDEDDSAVPDRATDIKPHLLGSKTHQQEREDDENEDNNDEGSDDDYDDDDDETYTEWNLRKCSAAALDVIAVTFDSEMIDIFIPCVKDKFFSADWKEKESSILALGAVAEGCLGSMEQHLPALMGLLVDALDHPKSLVRSITCWTIGRYSGWIIRDNSTPAEIQTYFLPVLRGLLDKCLDKNKRVQEAGCSALATLEEAAGPQLEPYLPNIISSLVLAFQKYQQKNLLILYDALGTLADAVGSALNNPSYIEMLMPPLIQRYNQLDDEDIDLIPLLECLSSIVLALGTGFIPYAQHIFQRCVRIISNGLIAYQSFAANPTVQDEPDKTFLIVSLDLLSGLTQGLNSMITELYAASNPPVLTLLDACLRHPDAGVRQSSYALLGDTAISCFPILQPALDQFMPGLIEHITLNAGQSQSEISVCNNAAWAVGEIAVQAGANIRPWVNPLMEKIGPVLMGGKVARSLMENSAVTIGRLALACPDIIAPHLEHFIVPWCQALADIKDNEEKDSAFQGICLAIQINPEALSGSFGYFLNAIARWTSPSPQLTEMFNSQLHAFKNITPPETWEAQINMLVPHMAARLRQKYQV